MSASIDVKKKGLSVLDFCNLASKIMAGTPELPKELLESWEVLIKDLSVAEKMTSTHYELLTTMNLEVAKIKHTQIATMTELVRASVSEEIWKSCFSAPSEAESGIFEKLTAPTNTARAIVELLKEIAPAQRKVLAEFDLFWYCEKPKCLGRKSDLAHKFCLECEIKAQNEEQLPVNDMAMPETNNHVADVPTLTGELAAIAPFVAKEQVADLFEVKKQKKNKKEPTIKYPKRNRKSYRPGKKRREEQY